MTTVAYRAGVIAGDGRETDVDKRDNAFVLRDSVVKVHRLKDGSLFGCGGSSEDEARLLAALQNNHSLPKLEDISALRIDHAGRIWLYEGVLWQPVKEKYYAVGSGAGFALAAMDAGASAIQAVRIGIKRDPFSGGTVTSLRL